MAEKFKENAQVMKQECIGTGIYSMWLKTEKIAGAARPGQFVSVYCTDGSRLLPRPISICEIGEDKKSLRLVYRVAGKGTGEFAKAKAGDVFQVLGPLGNGFPLERCQEGKTAFLIGGGIGIPPMLELSKQLKGNKMAVLGYRDERFLDGELSNYADVYIATEDGSMGTKGNVLDAIKAHGLKADVIFACGPTPMLRALKAYAEEEGIECWLSLEERMACGVGACLGCVCHSKEIDDHSKVHNKRVCKDGPVFSSTEVVL